MLISSNFDSGNITIINTDAPDNIRLRIKADNQSEFLQWFHFRASGIKDIPHSYVIENAKDAAFTDGWDGYNVCASYDRDTWFRIPTDYKDGALTWSFESENDSIWFAYFAPYSMERHGDLIAEVSNSPLVHTSVLGQTLDGQDMDLVEVGYGPEGRKKVWLIARQHPGETMAEWWMEGAFDTLLDPDNPVARRLLEKAHFYIVPNMNPDGSRRGHLRTNAAGVNLNRVWEKPSMGSCPEVYLVREKMLETGVDFHMDVHGDEGLPYNFLAGFEGIPSLKQETYERFLKFQELLCWNSPDFQREKGYEKSAPGEGSLCFCTNYVAETFGCVAMTLEMPFKDNANLPDEDFGWTPEKCQHLASACLLTLSQIIDDI